MDYIYTVDFDAINFDTTHYTDYSVSYADLVADYEYSALDFSYTLADGLIDTVDVWVY